MQASNQIKMKVLADGTISVETDSFEKGTVHMQADALIKETVKLTGGTVEAIKKKPGHHHHEHIVLTQEQESKS